MNRTLLLENLPDLLEDLDARLTALEAAEPQAQPVKISYVEHLAAEVKRLTAERNALGAQLDDLRNVNAGLRQDNERLTAEVKQLASERKTLSSVWHALKIDNERLADQCARLRAAIEAVEYDGEFGTCLWCNSLYGYEHFQNCQRQAALR